MTRVKRFTPQFTAMIDEAARVCFGNRPVVNHRTDFKLLKKIPYAPVAVNYYVPDMVAGMRKLVPEFKSDLEERREEKLIRLKSRNKGPPKKGQGSRAKKRK